MQNEPTTATDKGRTPDAEPSRVGRREDGFFRTDHLLKDLKGRSVRGGAVTLGAQFLKLGLQIGALAVLARLLSPEDFGLVAMVTAITGFIGLFKDAGLSMATVQRADITQEQVNALFWINVGLSVVLMLVTAAIAPGIAYLYGEPRLTWIAIAISATFILGGLTVQHHALLQRQMRFKALSVIGVLGLVVGLASAMIAAGLYGAGYWALVIMVVAQALTEAILAWLFSGWRPGRPRLARGVRPLLSVGGNLTGHRLTDYGAQHLDDALIGWFWGATALGFYSRAYSLLYLPITQIASPIGRIMIPALSRVQHEVARFRDGYLRALTFMLWVFLPLNMALIVLADEVVLLALGEQWLEVVSIFRFLTIGGLLFPVSHSTGWLFISSGRTDKMFRWGVVSLVVTALVIVISLPWGIVAVAVAYGVSRIPLGVALLIYATRGSPVSVWLVARAACWPAGAAVTGGVLSATATVAMRPAAHVTIVLAVGAATILLATAIIAWHSGAWRLFLELYVQARTNVMSGAAPDANTIRGQEIDSEGPCAVSRVI